MAIKKKTKKVNNPKPQTENIEDNKILDFFSKIFVDALEDSKEQKAQDDIEVIHLNQQVSNLSLLEISGSLDYLTQMVLAVGLFISGTIFLVNNYVIIGVICFLTSVLEILIGMYLLYQSNKKVQSYSEAISD